MEENRNAAAPDDRMTDAVKLLVAYLKKRDIRLTEIEWIETLLSLGAQREQILELISPAVAADIILREGPDPDREKYTLPLVLHVFLQIKIDSGRMSDHNLDVLSYRFGLDDGYIHTPGETAAKFGITREQVRAIEYRTIHSLSRPKRAKKIRDFYC